MKTKKNQTEFSYDFDKFLKKMIYLIPIGFLINIAFALYKQDAKTLYSFLHFSPKYILLAGLFTIIPWFTNVGRLLIWTRFLGTKLSFIEGFRIIVYSELGAAVSPTAIGSAPVKIGLLMQKRMSPGSAISLASITSLEDFAFFIIAIPASFIISSALDLSFFPVILNTIQEKVLWVVGIVVLILLFIFGIYIIFKNNKGKYASNMKNFIIKLKNIYVDFKQAYLTIATKGKLRFLLSATLTGIQWICRYSIITALAASLGIATKPVLFFLLQWIVFTLAIFIPTPGATGGAEATLFFIFHSFLPEGKMGIITAGWRILSLYIFLLMGGMIFMLLRFFRSINKSKIETPARILPETSTSSLYY